MKSLLMLSRLTFKKRNCALAFCSASDGSKLTFSQLYDLPSQVKDNMTKLGLIYPTDIQKRSLGSLLGVPEERCTTVVNAETGSGKTLCFLLPVLKMFGEMWQREGSIPRGSAAILVPTPHLAQQVSDVFKSLAHPEWNCSVAAFHHSSFSYTKYSHLLVAVPGKLKHYSLDTLFNNNRILCLDEVDTLLIGGEESMTKTILKKVQSTHKILQQRNDDSRRMQVREDECIGDDSSSADVVWHRPNIILTAATLPSKGPQTVGKQILSLMRKVAIFKTETTHKILPNVDLRFVPCGDFVSKFQQLEGDLDRLKVGHNLPKVLVFANTKESAREVTDFLHGGYQTKSHSQVAIPLPKWWVGRVGSFYNQPGVFSEARESVVKAFRDGSLRVLVCSDLGSRGLDFPDCSAVIQFDFPENSEFFLHRAGRTARAGKAGVVISYVSETDQDMAKEIQKVIGSTNMSFDSLFSRNKMFRRKIKRRRKGSESI